MNPPSLNIENSILTPFKSFCMGIQNPKMQRSPITNEKFLGFLEGARILLLQFPMVLMITGERSSPVAIWLILTLG